MSTLEDNLGGLLSQAASEISRRALALDPELQVQLAQWSGRRIEINCELPRVTWYIEIAPHSLEVFPGRAPSPHATVSGSALDLAAWLTPFSSNSPGSVTISGDETLLMEIADMMRRYRPDPAPLLAPLMGNELANSLAGAAEMGLKGLSSIVDGIGYSLQNQAASRFVSERQFDSLADGIDALRLRVDRLAANVQQAEQRRLPEQPDGE